MPSLPFAATLGVLLVFAGLLGLGGVLVILVVANRADPDPTGRRPAVVYQFATAFVTLFATLFGTFGAVDSLVQLIGSHPGGGSGFSAGPIHPVGDAVARGVVLSLLVTAVAGLALLAHLRAALDQTADGGTGSPAVRVRQSYVSAVCFVAVLIAVVSTVVGMYDLFRIIAPGVFRSAGGSVPPVRSLLAALYLGLAATLILVAHLRLLPPPLRPRLRPVPRPVVPGVSGPSEPVA